MSAGKLCKHCGSELVVKQTHRTPQQLKKPYYYTAYYLCPTCGRIYHSEEFKIVNNNYGLFTKLESAVEPVDVEIWTDGACVNNGQPQASAAWAFVAGEYEKGGKVEGKQTNNRAEAQAILEALKWAGETGKRRVKILADTQITLHGVMKVPEKVLANRDIFEQIAQTIRDYDLDVQYEKVLAHSGIEENERVDKLANAKARKV